MAAALYIPLYLDINLEIDYKNLELHVYLKIKRNYSNARAQRPVQYHSSF